MTENKTGWSIESHLDARQDSVHVEVGPARLVKKSEVVRKIEEEGEDFDKVRKSEKEEGESFNKVKKKKNV